MRLRYGPERRVRRGKPGSPAPAGEKDSVVNSSRKPSLVFWASLLACLLLSAVVTRGVGMRAVQIERAEMERQLVDRANAFRQALWLRLYQLETLDILLRLHDGKPIHFAGAAKSMERISAVSGVLLAPGGIVSQVWPEEGRERYLGLNLLKDPTLQRLIHTGKNISLSGPFPLSETQSVLYGYKLVFLPGREGQEIFWGILAFYISFEDLLREAGLETWELQGRHLRLMRDDGSATPLSLGPEIRPMPASGKDGEADDGPPTGNVLEYSFDTAGAWWSLWVYPVGIWWQNPAVWPFALGCLACSLLVALLARQVCVQRRTRQALEKLLNHDALTGALNRHGLFRELEQKGRMVGRGAFLAYVDLNKFKQVNDTCGHEAGDRVLRAFVDAVSRHTDERVLLARIGGDEFVLLFPVGMTRLMVEDIIADIRTTYAEPLELCGGRRLHCRFACGLVFWPEQEADFQAVLHRADIAMYRDKHRQAKEYRDI